MALDRIQNSYPQSQVIVLAYHYGDSYNIFYCNTRIVYYGVASYPNVWFNGYTNYIGGVLVSQGETGIQMMYNTYVDKINAEKTRTAGNNPFQLVLRGGISPTYSAMTLYMSSATGYPRTVNAIFLIAEEAIPISSSNGQTVLNAVVRGWVGTKSFTLTSSGSTTLNTSIGSIPYYTAAHLSPVVILQDSSTKEIIGAVTEFTLPTNISCQWQLYN